MPEQYERWFAETKPRRRAMGGNQRDPSRFGKRRPLARSFAHGGDAPGEAAPSGTVALCCQDAARYSAFAVSPRSSSCQSAGR